MPATIDGNYIAAQPPRRLEGLLSKAVQCGFEPRGPRHYIRLVIDGKAT